MQPYFSILALFLSLPLSGQQTLYYTKIGEPTDSAGATYRHEITNLPNGWTYIKEYRPINTLFAPAGVPTFSLYPRQRRDSVFAFARGVLFKKRRTALWLGSKWGGSTGKAEKKIAFYRGTLSIFRKERGFVLYYN